MPQILKQVYFNHTNNLILIKKLIINQQFLVQYCWFNLFIIMQSQQSRSFQTVGLMKFKRQTSEQTINYFRQQLWDGFFKQLRWNIKTINIKRCQWEKLLEIIQQAKCNWIHLDQIQHPTSIPKLIVLPFYSLLQNLVLTRCQIYSIQFFTFINAPKLFRIKIWKTQLNSIKPLNKIIGLPMIMINYLQENKHSQIALNRIRMDKTSQSMEFIRTNEANSIAILAKAQCIEVKEIRYSKKYYVFEERLVINAIKRKYPGTKLRMHEGQ